MEESKPVQPSKVRKLVLNKDTVRVLSGKEAKSLIGGLMAASDRECTCTCKCRTILSTNCCK